MPSSGNGRRQTGLEDGALTAASAQRRQASDDAILLHLLDAVERDPAVTQRSVARELGIALGLANAYLRRCVRKGLIKVGQAPPRRYVYYLTPQGFAEKSQLTARYLLHSFSFLREARTQCAAMLDEAAARGHRRLVLVGAGELADIAALVAHDHPIQILGTVAANADAAALARDLERFRSVDAVAITAIENAQAAFDAALVRFGPHRLYAPALLRIRRPMDGAAHAEDRL